MPRLQPGLCYVAVIPLFLLSRIGEARMPNVLSRLFTYGMPAAVVLVGASLVISIVLRGASTLDSLTGITYATGGGLLALATFILGVAFVRSSRA